MTQSGPETVARPQLPVSPVAMVRRERLLARLDAASDARVIALTAPGGFGKSTLLAQWLAESASRIVWLTVPRGSDSLDVAERVAAELTSATSAKTRLPVVHDDALWFSVVLPALATMISNQAEPFVLVLDDAMNVSGRLSDSLIESVVASLPEGSQLVIGTRGVPPHAVRRLRSTGRTLELDAADLAMDDREARLLLEELTVHLPGDQLTQVVRRTEGWPVGIYLLGRAVLNDPDLLATEGAPLATTEWINDYIRDELFAELTPEDAAFLMRVSVLDDLTGPVCDAVASVSGSLVRLRRLSAGNQLITCIPGSEVRYRLHQLFADFLRTELRVQSVQDYTQTHARAAEWYADHDEHEQAVSHLRQADDDVALGDFIWSQAWWLLSRGQVPVLRRWIADIDDERIASHPGLSLSAVWIGIHGSDIAKVQRFAASARHLLDRGDVTGNYASHVAITEAVIGADGLASIAARTSEAIDAREPLDPWMSLAFFMRGVAQLHFNRVDEGMSDLVEGYRIAEALDVTHMRAHCLAGQGIVRLAQGDNPAAGDLMATARAVVFDNDLEHIPTGAPIFTASALVLLATGQRAEAAADAARALRLTALFEPVAPWHAVEGRLRLAQVYRGLGDHGRARVLTTEARDRYTPAAHSPLLDGMLAEFEAQLEQSSGTGPLPSLLTTAELRVVQYLPSHLTFPEIGAQLWLSRHTVKSQALSAYRKLGVTSRSDAVVRARELGLLPEG